MTLLTGNPIKRVLEDLTACLRRELEDPDNGVPRPCTITITPGETVTPEYQGECEDSADPEQESDCGIAWVRMVNSYPASAVGQQDNTVGNCNTSIGFDVNIGITRCFDPGEPLQGPSSDELSQTAFLSVADMLVMMKAIRCCDALTSKDYILHGYQPIGPIGGMVGGSWTVSVVV